MVPLYTLMLTALAGVKWALAGRAARTETKYTRAALDAEKLAREMQAKPGASSHADTFTHAKRQYELGRVVEKRDRLEAKFLTCQVKADKVAALVAKLRGWNGRVVPYLFGVVDVALLLVLLDRLGFPHGLDLNAIRAWAEALVK